jgi:hypothetical protein
VVFPVFSFPVARRRRGRFVDYQPDQGDAYDENETLTRPGYEGARSRSRERPGGTGGVEQRKVGVTLTARGGTDYTGGRRQRGLSLQTSERWRVDFSVSSSSRAVSRSSSRSTDNIPSLVAFQSFDSSASSCSLSTQRQRGLVFFFFKYMSARAAAACSLIARAGRPPVLEGSSENSRRRAKSNQMLVRRVDLVRPTSRSLFQCTSD